MFKDGKEYAHQQYLYPYIGKEEIVSSSVSVTEDFLNVGFQCENTNIIFSKQKGLVSYRVNNNELIRVPLRPNFYRAPVNNDVENGHGFRYGQWLANSLYAKMIYRGYTADDQSASIIFDCALPSAPDVYVTMQYEIYGDGSMAVYVRVPAIEDQIEMPCFGVLWRTYPQMDHVDYIGLGPDENMYDRHKGALYGAYSYEVKDNLTPYLYPQECGTRTADIAALDSPEPQNRRFKNGENSSSRTADAAPTELQNLRPSYTDKRKNDESYIEVSPSVTEGPDEEELTGILDACELSSFEPEMARIFETAIERLFYSDSFRVGNATLPQSRVRHRLHDLDNLTLRDTEQRLRANQESNIRNSIQYTMAVLFNCITEGESDLVVDPYLNSLGEP